MLHSLSDLCCHSSANVPVNLLFCVEQGFTERAAREELRYQEKSTVIGSARTVEDDEVGMADHLQSFALFAEFCRRVRIDLCECGSVLQIS